MYGSILLSYGNVSVQPHILCLARQLDLLAHDHARLHLSRLQAKQLFLDLSASYVLHDGQLVHPITWQVFSESGCPFPNTFQGRLPRWFDVTNHLDHQVDKSRHTTSNIGCYKSKRPNLHLDLYNNYCNKLICAFQEWEQASQYKRWSTSQSQHTGDYVDIYVSIIAAVQGILFFYTKYPTVQFLGFINEGITVTASLILLIHI